MSVYNSLNPDPELFGQTLLTKIIPTIILGQPVGKNKSS